MIDENDPPPPDLEVRRLQPIRSDWMDWLDWRDDLRLPDVRCHGEPGTVEYRIRGVLHYIVTDLEQRVCNELKQEQSGRWPEMRRGMLLDIQRNLANMTLPLISPELRPLPMKDYGWPAEIMGLGDIRTIEMQLCNISADMRLLAMGLDQLEREDADTLARWLRDTANQLDPWGEPT